MVTIRKKIFFIPVFESWSGIHKSFYRLCCVGLYNNVKDEVRPTYLLHKSKSIILEVDLACDDQLIFAKFTKQVRNCIRQAERLGVQCNFGKDTKSFIEFYNAFAKEKGIPILHKKVFERLGENIYLSFAIYNDEIYAAHWYVVDRDAGYSVLYRSASRRLIDKSLDANFVGKANKLLHYHDMLYFKKMGIIKYEFGGYGFYAKTDPLFGITRFKSCFGGEVSMADRYQTIPYYLIYSTKKKIETAIAAIRQRLSRYRAA